MVGLITIFLNFEGKPSAVESHLRSILLKYWGFSSFRPLQEDIIQSVLDGKDTLALLPTGGGKSICYQVPAMSRDGLCLVVTPLVALMKDQVQALRNRQIPATAIYHGLSRREMDVAVDNCVFGDTKFLYLSPERLTTELIRTRIPRMNILLLAVDEAHCISQWGYDFRPPYLRIAEVRDLMPGVPILALTATATSQVIEDIQQKLQFGKSRQLFRKSFERKNLAYMVFREEDKLGRLLRISKKTQGTGIVYVRNRKKTREISDFLVREGVAADHYHAGLTTLERDMKQDAWMKERSRVIVSTNAFGMGIDKPNVRFVVHMDLPESPEAYFQEAGRAGRDGNKSFAVLLFNQSDVLDLERFHEVSYPPVEYIRKVYQCLGNYFQLAVGGGKDQSFPFDMGDFSSRYALDTLKVYNSLQFLEREGYIALSDALSHPSRIMFIADKEELYRFQVANPLYDSFIKLLLRSHSGLFSEFIRIREQDLARRAGLQTGQAEKYLSDLHRQQLLLYEKQNQQPLISWVEERLSLENLRISKENHKERKAFAWKRLKAMLDYVQSDTTCRSMFLLAYFGEKQEKRCGQCDVCIDRNRLDLSDYEFEHLSAVIKKTLQEHGPLSPPDFLGVLPDNVPEDKIIRLVAWLKDYRFLKEGSGGKLHWVERSGEGGEVAD